MVRYFIFVPTATSASSASSATPNLFVDFFFVLSGFVSPPLRGAAGAGIRHLALMLLRSAGFIPLHIATLRLSSRSISAAREHCRRTLSRPCSPACCCSMARASFDNYSLECPELDVSAEFLAYGAFALAVAAWRDQPGEAW